MLVHWRTPTSYPAVVIKPFDAPIAGSTVLAVLFYLQIRKTNQQNPKREGKMHV